jgi:hypothetical protein
MARQSMDRAHGAEPGRCRSSDRPRPAGADGPPGELRRDDARREHEQGRRRAFQESTRSGRAANLMDGLMRIARQMENGDATVGMTRMMEMMGRGDGPQ